MKFCPLHWNALREMVIAKGMGDLIRMHDTIAAIDVPKPSVVVEELLSQDYDPLAGAYWALMAQALHFGGDYLLFSKPGDGGFYCPLCEVEIQGLEQENKAGLAQNWLEGCTDSVLVYCRENNLLSKAH